MRPRHAVKTNWMHGTKYCWPLFGAVLVAMALGGEVSGQLSTGPEHAAVTETTSQLGSSANTAGQDVDFRKEVQPILKKRCLECHGPDLQESGFRVDQRDNFLAGGDLYPRLIHPGDPENSPFLAILKGTDSALQMPPDGEPLSAEEIALIELWIRQGAQGLEPEGTVDEAASSWWSLQPMAVGDPPLLQNAGAGETTANHPIDQWLDAKLHSVGLRRSPDADPRTLARRVYLTLTGLPPTAAQLEQFLLDPSAAAYERLVDQLLDSPQLGVHWGQQWLDVVRFAESDGFETNHDRPNAYHYRDWVIDSWNHDLPFDAFVRHQLTGDQTGHEVATGFLVAGTYDIVKGQDDDLSKVQRENELADMVNTTSTAVLGLTVGCARCHSHKFDPISQSEYYAMQSVFAGVYHGERTIPRSLTPQEAQRLAEADKILQEGEATFFAQARPAVSHGINRESFASQEVRYLRFSIQATNSAEPCIDELEVFGDEEPSVNLALATRGVTASSSGNYQGDPKHQLPHIHDGLYGNDHSWIASTVTSAWVQLEWPQPVRINSVLWSRDRRDRPPAFADRLPIDYRIEVSRDGATWMTVASSEDRRDGIEKYWQTQAADSSPTSVAAVEQWWAYQQAKSERSQLTQPRRVYAGEFRAAPTVFRLHRGEHRQPREEVSPQSLSAVLGPESFSLSSQSGEYERRLALANWLVDERNPLTYRVAVNRLWQGVFGAGIVATSSDFGRMGARPTHLELLDWLANYMLQSGKSRKAVLRLLVTSQAFRQSSAPRPEALAVDAQSQLLWRYPPRRKSAEMIRDSLLLLTGKLDLRLGGPGFLLYEPNDNYARNWVAKTNFSPTDFRRLAYATKIRMERDAIFAVFDLPDGGQICPVRSRSTTPLQALNMFNSEFVLARAAELAEAIQRECPQIDQQIITAFRDLLQRAPDDKELEWSRTLVQEYGLASVCRALINTNEFMWME